LVHRLSALARTGRPVWIVALGKAASPMAEAAIDVLTDRDSSPAGGIIIGPTAGTSPHPLLQYLAGDHPEPGPGSLAAAAALGRIATRISPDDEVWLLLSGGTSSLIAAPESGLAPEELRALYGLLLGSGLDISAMNRVRKRFSRWGGGKLARALAPARVRTFVVSDVIGDDLTAIGSGPCVPDPTSAAEVRELLLGSNLWHRVPEPARRLVLDVEAGKRPETPKPGDPAFTDVSTEIIASNRLALEAAASRARELGLEPQVAEQPIAGEARSVGAMLAQRLLEQCRRSAAMGPQCLIWGGETTVTLGERPAGLGGRCQELSLAAAEVLSEAPGGVALLAAGTDGRDGPTDAAGAVVDGGTWQAILDSGRDPKRDLEEHNSYWALEAAGALLKPGLTGTNVMDVVIGICVKDAARARAGSHRPELR
jgi:glycerate 2-kinase